jgi:predicted NodU family carbamoyl transferase
MYAVADRVYPKNASKSKPQRSIKSLSMDEFLPTSVVQEAFVEDLSDIIPRILVTYLKSYKPLRKAVTKHIVHPHSEEMKKQSEWVMLIKLLKLKHLTSKYFFCNFQTALIYRFW